MTHWILLYCCLYSYYPHLYTISSLLLQSIPNKQIKASGGSPIPARALSSPVTQVRTARVGAGFGSGSAEDGSESDDLVRTALVADASGQGYTLPAPNVTVLRQRPDTDVDRHSMRRRPQVTDHTAPVGFSVAPPSAGVRVLLLSASIWTVPPFPFLFSLATLNLCKRVHVKPDHHF
jgi:hypothetical protein